MATCEHHFEPWNPGDVAVFNGKAWVPCLRWPCSDDSVIIPEGEQMALSHTLHVVERLQAGGAVPEGGLIRVWVANYLEAELHYTELVNAARVVVSTDQTVCEDYNYECHLERLEAVLSKIGALAPESEPTVEDTQSQSEPEPKSVPQKIDMDISDYERLHMEHSRCVWALERILRPITWATMDSEGLVCTIAREALNHPEPKPEPTQDEDDNSLHRRFIGSPFTQMLRALHALQDECLIPRANLEHPVPTSYDLRNRLAKRLDAALGYCAMSDLQHELYGVLQDVSAAISCADAGPMGTWIGPSAWAKLCKQVSDAVTKIECPEDTDNEVEPDDRS